VAPSRTSIPGYLARVRALVYRHEALRAALLGFVALAGLALVVPLIGWLLVGTRTAAVTVLSSAGLVAALVILSGVVLGVVAPRRRYGKDRDLARWVGSRHSPIASDLLSAVELANAPVRPGAPSPELVDALIESTASELDEISPRSLLPDREIPKARTLAIAATAVHIAMLIVVPGVIGRGWRALLFPPPAPFDGAELSNVPLVGDLTATLTFPSYSKRRAIELPSSSGDVRGLPGTIVTLKARVLVPAARVELVI